MQRPEPWPQPPPQPQVFRLELTGLVGRDVTLDEMAERLKAPFTTLNAVALELRSMARFGGSDDDRVVGAQWALDTLVEYAKHHGIDVFKI